MKNQVNIRYSISCSFVVYMFISYNTNSKAK